ncbi:MAG: hypothetical protein IKK14_03465 [Oscillospiraceae bacterium]|nr:hypothetical protein [Oscillospiraceae bacterium]
MRILIVSCESWRDTNNGGNVLSNIFCAFPEAEIAQIYCSGELPQNSICKKYFQISDLMLIKSEKGEVLEEKDYSTNNSYQEEAVENKIKNKIPDFFRESFLLMREVLWIVFNWRTEKLRKFITDFKPDVIFAPCYSYFHVSKLALYVKDIAKCPMISYISDDNYSLKQFVLSPFFWVNRLITRKWIRRLFSECSLVYTMTEMQKKEYENLLGRPMKVLCKSADFCNIEKKTGTPIKFIYGGGLYLNRWKVLEALVKSLDAVNETGIKAELHIYSNSKLTEKQKRLLNNRKSSFFHGAVSFSELEKKYAESDVAVHVESFDRKNRAITRLSFSTKIIDCMKSGCAILAIGPHSQAGISYLKSNDAAICVNDLNKLNSSIAWIIDNEDLIQKYAQKAKELGQKNHNKEAIEKMIKKDFYDIVSGDKS